MTARDLRFEAQRLATPSPRSIPSPAEKANRGERCFLTPSSLNLWTGFVWAAEKIPLALRSRTSGVQNQTVFLESEGAGYYNLLQATMSARGEGAGEPSGSQEDPGTAPPAKRGPGRPRKPQQEPTGEPVPKRPRGRPKGSKNKGPSKAAQKKAEGTGEKRPRGRPRKWPQQVVQEKPAQEEEEEEEAEESGEED
ncbi:hypothetical protein GJAV_G00270010 [Gymnothorax javanicus]|nr:hypothetical protein GJAV_G00270010 [Gymnothorax javanicus]